ncbi:hypothetical protein D3C74_398620 [compost metagenome]
MPMKTRLLSRAGPPGMSPSASDFAAERTCSTISAVDRLRVRPSWPVAQNGHAMPQPAWLETHSVDRFGYRMRTDSTLAASKSFQSVLTVVPPSACITRAGVSSCGNRFSTSRSREALGRSVMSSAALV